MTHQRPLGVEGFCERLHGLTKYRSNQTSNRTTGITPSSGPPCRKTLRNLVPGSLALCRKKENTQVLLAGSLLFPFSGPFGLAARFSPLLSLQIGTRYTSISRIACEHDRTPSRVVDFLRIIRIRTNTYSQ